MGKDLGKVGYIGHKDHKAVGTLDKVPHRLWLAKGRVGMDEDLKEGFQRMENMVGGTWPRWLGRDGLSGRCRA